MRFNNRLRSKVPLNVEGKPLPDDQWFPQILDHFHPTDDRMWKQRYFVNDTFYKEGGPIFLMIGGEGEANPIWMVEGTWIEYAREVGALCFQLEHRYFLNWNQIRNELVPWLEILSQWFKVLW